MPDGCKTLILLLLTLGVGEGLHAQSKPFKAEHLTIYDGLTDDRIQSITQDPQGFMWIGTADGLHRYDGYTFTIYRNTPDDPRSVSGNNILALYVDRQGTLWVGTGNNGLNRYDPATDTFTDFRNDPDDATSLSHDTVTALHEDHLGNLWIGTFGGGLNKMAPDRSGRFTRYRHDPNDPSSLSHDEILAVMEDRAGSLWIGTQGGGLNRFDPEAETFTHYVHDPADETSLLHNDVKTLHEGVSGTLWVGTSRNGVHRMNRDTGTFTRYVYTFSHANRLAQTSTVTWPGTISLIHEDTHGALWIGSTNGGVDRFEQEGNNLVSAEGIPGRMQFNLFQTAYASRDGTLWFGASEGLFRVDPVAQPVMYFAIDSPRKNDPVPFNLYKDHDDILWVGTNDGLLRYDRTTGAATWYQHDPNDPTSLSNDVIVEIYEDRLGSLWFGTFGGGLNKLDRTTGTFTHYRHDPADATSLTSDILSCFYEDRAGTLWIGTFGGLNKMNRATGTFTRYRHDPADSTSLSHDFVQTCYTARDGTLWLGLINGLNRYNAETETFSHFQADPDNPDPRITYDVHQIFEDRAGMLWYGAPHNKGGINHLDPKAGRFSHRPSNTYAVYNFLEDDAGNVWVSGDDGLTMYDLEQGTATTLEAESELTMWSGAVELGRYRDESGELFFGTPGGIYTLFPEEILNKATSRPPQVALTDLHVSSQPVRPGEGSPLPSAIWSTEAVTLAPDQNTFSFTFAGLHYRNPSGNRYKYMLANYDETWREAGAERTAVYTKVPPGEYVFRVQAANSDGVWSEEGTSVAVVVLPPWWQTWWAYLLYGLLFIGGIFAVDRVQRRRLLRKEREKARERELEQAREIEKAHNELQQAHKHLKATQTQLVQQEKLASLGQLTAGIAHEIKNPLNFVNNFADLNEELAADLNDELTRLQDHLPPDVADDFKETLSYMQVNASKIREQGQRADGIVQSMMQHASGGASEREACDVDALVAEYAGLAYHGKRAQVPTFNVDLQQDSAEVGAVSLVPQEIGRVLLNLCGNAFDAVYEKARSADGAYEPSVSISTRRNSDMVEIHVCDNGPGIPEGIRQKIFEPFYTTKPTGSGTGLGLSLSYDIVTQGHGGMLTVESGDGEGATFVVTLPVKI